MGSVVLLNQPSKDINKLEIYNNNPILIGRNFKIQKIVSLLTNENSQRIMKVFGGSGLGKKCCVLQAAKYSIERSYFRDGATILDIRNRINTHSFFTMLCKKMRLEIKRMDDLYSIIRDMHMVIIIKDADHFLQQELE